MIANKVFWSQFTYGFPFCLCGWFGPKSRLAFFTIFRRFFGGDEWNSGFSTNVVGANSGFSTKVGISLQGWSVSLP